MTRLQWFLRLSEMTQEQFGERIGVTGVSVGRYCRDRSDPDHRQPRRGTGDKMAELSQGEIHLGNYADPISEEAAKAMMAEIARKAKASA